MNHSPDQKLLRAERLKKLRKMTHYSRKAFAEKYQISQGTLQNWETARFGGLTEKGARSMIKILSQEGLFCSFEWLMYGIGNSPIIASESPLEETTDTKQPIDQTALIASELALFRKQNGDTISTEVQDDAMFPVHIAGQTVAGRKRTGKNIDDLLNKICIVETLDAQILVRYVKQGDSPKTYHLIALNEETTAPQPYLTNVELISAAPVSWVRNANTV